MSDYDEFGGLPAYAAGVGLPREQIPPVERVAMRTRDREHVSGLRWGSGEPEIVYLHGGAQNAHTWDAVALAVGRPALALDLPGHGHSSWRQDRNYSPRANADAVAEVIADRAPQAGLVVGMSLGGLTLISLASAYPELVRRALIVDVTPGVSRHMPEMTPRERGATLLTQGPRVFDSLEAMVDAAVAVMPARSRESLWWGVRHNAKPLADGTWVWRYDTLRAGGRVDLAALWDELSAIRVPVLLARGGTSAFVTEADIDEFVARQPRARVATVPDSGHSVQSDQPVLLAKLINEFLQDSG
ncbi:MAG: alpha/beta fold hydrolase [Streptosporangiaceae bacterium]